MQISISYQRNTTRGDASGRSAGPPLRPGNLDARLQSALRALRAPPPTRATPADQSFVTPDEAASYTPDQLEFLVRKRRAAAGLGPLMPEGSLCSTCGGKGQCACHRCGGTGENQTEGSEIMAGNERGQIVQNTPTNLQWFFMKGGPCWLCRGGKEIPCPDCQGTGFSGGMAGFEGD